MNAILRLVFLALVMEFAIAKYFATFPTLL